MKAFIIYLPNRPHSVETSSVMLKKLKQYKIDAELFEGVPGDVAVDLAAKSGKVLYTYGIKNRVLTQTEIRDLLRDNFKDNFSQTHHAVIHERSVLTDVEREKCSRPGVVGCFYSHYALWEKCVDLNEPIMIFEDDVKFFRKYYPVEFDDILILSLGKNSFESEPWKTFLEKPTGTPYAATWKNFSMPGASGYIIKPHVARGLIKFYRPYWYPADNAINQFLCKIQINSYLMGRNTTADEGNISMTKTSDWNDK